MKRAQRDGEVSRRQNEGTQADSRSLTQPSPRGESASGRLAENILYFARALRAAGIPVGPGSVLDALEAVRPRASAPARIFTGRCTRCS